jgi:predicted RNase H-like nuclease
MRPGRHGPVLPYRLLAGAIPAPGGWLVASAKLQGITLSPEEPRVMARLTDVLDEKPAFEIIALAAPVGLLDDYRPGGRTCEREARQLLGWRRGAAVMSAPPRRAVEAPSGQAALAAGGVGAVALLLLPRIREVTKEIQPYWQRTVFEVHPELSFHQLNGDQPLIYSKRMIIGRKERRELLVARLPGVDRILDARLRRIRDAHLLDVAACLWTARRIAARAVQRLPEDPEWDSQGLRMELVR